MKNGYEEIADAIHHCLVSANVVDSNGEHANVVDVIDSAASNLLALTRAITPLDAVAMQTPGGGRVGSLTEAVIYVAESLGRIASAISELSDAVRDSAP